MNSRKNIILVIFTTIFLFICIPWFTADMDGNQYGILSIIPPVLAIFLAFFTKEVILSLFVGIFSGSLITTFASNDTSIIRKFVDSYVNTIDYPVSAVADKWHAGILIFTIVVGGLIGLISKMGGSKAIANALAKKAKTTRSGMLYTMLMGVIIFFDDYANALITGITMRPLTDKLKISREKLSYIVDTTAATIAGMALISTWIGYELGLIKDSLKAVGIEKNAYEIFFLTIPYRFYAILALVIVLFIALLSRDFGPMYKAEKRARDTGKVLGDNANPMSSQDLEHNIENEDKLKISNALIPLLTLIVFTFIGLWYSGDGLNKPFTFDGIRNAIGDADASIALIWSAVIACFVSIIMAVSKKIMTLKQAIEAWVEGAKSLMITGIILTLAWSIGAVTKDLGTAEYLVSIISGTLPGWTLPMLIFVLSGIIAFATGTSWGTMGILIPLSIPLAASYGEPGVITPLILSSVGAVLTGAIFGDHCSPISDTTIMSSMASSADHMDHVKTQMPYALTTAAVSIIFGYLPAGFGFPAWISLITGSIALFLIVRFIGKKV